LLPAEVKAQNQDEVAGSKYISNYQSVVISLRMLASRPELLSGLFTDGKVVLYDSLGRKVKV
jgi:hypothetical protein